MFRSTKVSIVALAAVFALVSGCKKPVKNITPIPGLGSVSTTNVTTVPGNDGVATAPPIRYRQPISTTPGNPFSGGDGTGGTGITSIPTKTTIDQTALSPRPFGDGTRDEKTLEPQTVYFDYDKSAIRASEKAKVSTVADYVKSHPGQSLTVEGHCDERGTDEYNRALGERRALSVRESLIAQGVPADRITTTSWGKDRPAELGHDEAAWSKNRRGAFVLTGAAGSVQ